MDNTTNALSSKTIVALLVLVTALKVLLIPSYFSTDFDVHRNWLAITRHLPLNEWYFDDVGGRTVHTLDYPPGFAWFEYALSNNFVTNLLLERGWLDERCLELLPDSDNLPSERCVIFHRCTVILSDSILYLGAYLASTAYGARFAQESDGNESKRLAFFLIVTNPGLIMLDHIHFQYNGMLLGILLCSIACIIRGVSRNKLQNQRASIQSESNQTWELLGAAFFAILLSMKHLYMTLAPLYLVYLLRHHCFVAKQAKFSITLQFSFPRFIVLAMVTLLCFLPFVPFLMKNPAGQMEQILKRLFPFGRGVSDAMTDEICILCDNLNLPYGFSPSSKIACS
jgi:alpha-1,3-glucosyltransferase